MMSSYFLLAFDIIKNNFFFGWFALLVFFAGFCSSFLVDMFNIKALIAFPKWFMAKIAGIVKPGSSFMNIFLFIFFFNSISILLYMTSGIFIILPFIITFITGMNVGITMFLPQVEKESDELRAKEMPKGALKIALYSTFVLILEVLAFSLAMGMGMSIAVASLSNYSYIYVISILMTKFISYLYVCVPVLFISAYLEATVIKETGSSI